MKPILEKVINKVADAKAQGDLILSSGKSLKMSVHAGNISEYKVSGSQMLGVRVIKDGRVGISYTEALDEDSLDLMVKQALMNAEFSEPNPDERIMELSGAGEDVLSYAEAEVDIAAKTKMTLELESKIKERDPRFVAAPYNYFYESEGESWYLSSTGRSTHYKDNGFGISTSALLEEAGKKSVFYHSNGSHTFAGLKFDEVIETALFHSQSLLQEKSLPTGRYTVCFNTDCLQSLFGCFDNFYSAKAAQNKMNPWEEKLGEVVVAKDLTIEDQPLFDKAYRVTKFDSEGVERAPLTLIEDGVLKNFYHNSSTARHFKTKTTGHASRGSASSLGVSGTHMVINGKNLKSWPDKYLEIIQMDGLYSGANRVSGEFSIGVKGYMWEKGERALAFGNVTLSGSWIELLKNAQPVNGKLSASTDESFFSIPLIFHDLSISGSKA